jgi:hypothetical protein
MFIKTIAKIFLMSAMLMGCTSTPTIQTGPDAEVSYDGLTRVDNTVMDAAWKLADIDLSGYTKVKLLGAGIEFRHATGQTSGSTSSMRRSGQSEFPLDESQQERLRQTITDAFTAEMSNSERFELVDTLGPDTLLVRGVLLDVVSRVPPDRIGGRSRIYLSSVGEATLVLEVRDSVTFGILARAVDRRAAARPGSTMQSNTVTNWAEVRRLANRWAGQLRVGLESLDPVE